RVAPASAPAAEPPAPAPPPPALTAPAEPLQVALEPLRMSLTLTNAALAYRLQVTNRGSTPLPDLSIGADMIAAHASMRRQRPRKRRQGRADRAPRTRREPRHSGRVPRAVLADRADPQRQCRSSPAARPLPRGGRRRRARGAHLRRRAAWERRLAAVPPRPGA